MNKPDPQTLIEKVKQLAPERIAEVEDSVDFLQAKDQERKLRRAAMQVAEPKLASVWDNDDDAAYDKL